MASAIGYALVQPPAVSLTIFLALAFGFAAPFTLVSLFPALAKILPRPGPWMDILKRALAFPMFGAWAWLVWVLAQQAGSAALAALLAASVVLSFAAWLYGIAQRRAFQGKGHRALFALTAALVVAVLRRCRGWLSLRPRCRLPGRRRRCRPSAGRRKPSPPNAVTARLSLSTSPPPGVLPAR